MALYPIELDLNGRTALVVGLGSVGRRKAAGLVAAGAAVIGVDPAVTSQTCPNSVSLRAEPYHERHLEGVSLVFAACTPEVNRRVVADARAARLWVNSASETSSGDFLMPAVWRNGGILLTVSTSGASPALAKMLRDRAAVALGEAAAGLAATLADLRPIVLAKVENPEIRREILNDWGNPRWLDLFAKGGAIAVRDELMRVLEEFTPGQPPLQYLDARHSKADEIRRHFHLSPPLQNLNRQAVDGSNVDTTRTSTPGDP